jgi:ubiquinone/menaquinone biosynthesis C-methylase UbiE
VVSDSTEHFDQLADRYVELRASPAYVDPVTEAVVELGSLRGCRVLDVGCGPGSVLNQLTHAFEVEGVGIDASSKMIDVARREAPETEFHVGRAERLPFGDQSFDAVISRLVVHHLDRRRAFTEMRRVLRRGGRIVLTTTDPGAFGSFWLEAYFPSYVKIERERSPDAETLRRELEEAELGDVRIEPFVLERRFDRETALEKLRGRAYSTFALISREEYETGVEAAEAGLPQEIVYDLRLLNVLARWQR